MLFNKDVTFGFEIEYSNAKHSQVFEELEEQGFKDWKSYSEPTVETYDKFGRLRGGEVVSSTFEGSVSNWESIKKVCDLIKFCLGEVNNKTAGHIHIGSQIFEKKPDKINNFLFLWGVFEDIIKKFFYGEFIQGDFFNRLAYDCRYEFLFAAYDFNNLLKLRDMRIRDKKTYAVSFATYKSFNKAPDNTIEFRAICGSLEPEIWQNNLNFLISFINWSCSITKDELEYIKEKYLLSGEFLQQESIKFEKAVFLADSIFIKELDKLCFLKQYFKDFYEKTSTKERVRLVNN